MLVLDLADDLLDQILDRDEPLGARIFVEHDREMGAAVARISASRSSAPIDLRHVERLADQRGDRRRAAARRSPGSRTRP